MASDGSGKFVWALAIPAIEGIIEGTALVVWMINEQSPTKQNVPVAPPLNHNLSQAQLDKLSGKNMEQDLDNSKPMEASNLANNPQKLSNAKGNKTSANSPKPDGGNKEVWTRFKEALRSKLGGKEAGKYLDENPDLRNDLHEFQKPYKVGQNVPKEDIPKVINDFIKQLEG